MIMYFNPLRIFLPLGAVFMAAGIGRGIYNRYVSPAATLQELDIILMVSAVLILVLGLLADLIVAQSRIWLHNSKT